MYLISPCASNWICCLQDSSVRMRVLCLLRCHVSEWACLQNYCPLLCATGGNTISIGYYTERGALLQQRVGWLYSIKCGPIGASWECMQRYLSLSTLHIMLPVQPCMVKCFAVGHILCIISGNFAFLLL